ncbi:hypothetical protein Hypma_009773 [Hypsizygus marmoreus]|uniref:AB hydrolase-1 domain-containing protein n=1 Tax=Hypsizygus marmoreus TaxID=39966 RepID=A0A369JW07_HYPMA|nr:hypothetical protein Hypma_009773 [Hypsizygus marmoreus]
MIGNTIPEYLFIRASITALRLIAPASIVYLGASAYYFSFLVSPWIGAFAIAEASFYLLVYLPRKRFLQAAPTYKPPPLTRSQRRKLFLKCCANLDIIREPDGVPYPAGWFLLPASQSQLRRHDLIDWLLWSLFSCSPEEAKPRKEEWKEELDEYVAKIEEQLGQKLNDGREDGVTSMRLTLDPVKMVHRPLLWYSIVCLVDTMTSLSLLHFGFKHYSTTQKWFQTFPPRPLLSFLSHKADISPDILLPYWYRPHKSSTKLPILFLHGIGIGMYPYLGFLRELIAQDPDVGILLVELLPISMHMTTHPIPPRPLLIKALNEILESLDISRVVLMAHSYGTFIAAYILRPPYTQDSDPESDTQVHLSLLRKLTNTVLVDPIPILLHLPPVAHNFLHRTPSGAAHWQLWYFASTDADVARTLGRAFFWEEGVLWKGEIRSYMRGEGEGSARSEGRNVAIVLAGDDQIVPSGSVRQYLTEEKEAVPRWLSKGWAWHLDGDDGSQIVDHLEEALNRKGGDLEVLFYPGLDHAMVFDSPKRREGILNILSRFVVELD